ncbi:MAG: hypothetical protein O2954_05990, partial [bacterium]|nr:hypothetical protein [bacterium]
MNFLPRPSAVLLFSLTFFLLLAGLPARSDAQYIPQRLQNGPVIDLANVPLNRTMPSYDWEREVHEFFPSLLGLTGPGARAIHTKYFSIYYTDAEYTARRIAEFADDVFEQLSSYYPGSLERYAPVNVLVVDNVDYLGNAYSFYLGNFIMFWASPSQWDVRGTNDWVRDVFTHELTHHVTLKAAHNSLPFAFGIVGASQSNQNPDFSFVLPLYHLALPRWFSEGIAQYESRKYGGDSWDTHRDMLLRMATLEQDLLSFVDAGTTSGKSGYHGEMVYNQGYALLNYIEDRFGTEKVRALSQERPILNFNSSIKKSLGISAGQLFSDWKAHIQKQYGSVADSIRTQGEQEGELISNRGSVETHPIYSPDGSRVAFLSNEGNDYALMRLMVMDLASRKAQEIKPGKYVDLPVSWTPDGNKLLYANVVGGFWDLFLYDMNTRKERRLTVGLRGRDPAISPDGKQIAFVGNEDGTSNLGLLNIDGTHIRYLTNNNDGTQYYRPQWSPDGKELLFTIFRGEDRDIAVIRADATAMPANEIRKKKDKPSAKPDQTLRPRKMAAIEKDSTTVATIPDSLTVNEDSLRVAREDSLKAFPDSLAYANNAGFHTLINSHADERDPVWLPDGSGIVYSSDRSGIFNLYSMDLTTGRHEQITNVIGGAFTPSVSPKGNDILYVGYHAANYNVYRVQKSSALATASVDTLRRDYRSIYTGEDIEDLFDVGRYSGQLSSIGVTPILLLGPTFIGNRFGLDQLSVGGEASWGDMIGSDEITTGFTIGKNLKKNVDLNSDLYFSYRKALPSIHTEHRTYSPRLFFGAERQTINSLIDQGIVAAQKDTSTGTLQVVIDGELRLIPNVTQYTNLSLVEEDNYKNLFNDFMVGAEIGLGRTQALSFTYGHHRYSESLHVNQVILDSTNIIQRNPDTGALTDITSQIPGVGDEQEVLDDFLYQELNYYRSNDLGVGWRYVSFTPAKDLFVNPSGGRAVTFRYRRINATITDSLALSADLNQDGIPDPSQGDVSPTLFRDDKTKLGINEYIFSWNEFLSFPGRTTLALQAFTAYKDKPIKEVQQNGGTSEGVFYFPLRYYLGGLGTLRGYPYFSLSGGKVFFGRASFTFPIVETAGKELPPFLFSKIYGTVFVETGATGNFESLSSLLDSDNKFKRSAFLTDWGFELRMQMSTFYSLPMFGYFQIAFPT